MFGNGNTKRIILNILEYEKISIVYYFRKET